MAEIIKYGLTREGFRKKRLPEIKANIEARISDSLGLPIEIGSNSVLGNLIGIYSYEIADLWEAAEAVYNAMYPSTAFGASLSNAAGLAGISLLAAQHTTVTATCYGKDGVVIPNGAQITTGGDNDTVYTCTDTGLSISASRANYVSLTIPANIIAGTAYTVTMDGKAASYTASSSDSKTTVLVNLASGFAFTDRMLTTSNDALEIVMTDAEDTFRITADNVLINLIGSPFSFKCETAGTVVPAIGALTQILTTVPGWSAVNNTKAAAVGRNAESDTSLRTRWNASLYTRSSTMVESIRAAILSNVDGVNVVTVYENDTDETDAYDRPRHSVEAIVEGGGDVAIAEQILKKKAAGITTFGSIKKDVTDSQGIAHTICFNRPIKVKIWIKIIVGKNPDETMPSTAVQKITSAVLEKGSAQALGEDVVLQRYFATIFNATQGIGYINMTACTGETAGAYTTDNVDISPRQIAVFDSSRIEVTLQ